MRLGQLHFGPVTLRWRIILGHFDELTDLAEGNLFYCQMQQFGGPTLCTSSQCLQEIVVVLPVVCHTRST